MKPLLIHRKGGILLGPEGGPVESLPAEFQKVFPDVSPKYIDSLSLMAGIAAGRALDGRGTAFSEETRRDFSVIVGSALGAMESVVDFDGQAVSKGPNTVNPMDFPNTVANAAGSRIGIWLQLKGPNVTLTNGDTSFLDAVGFAWEGMNSGLFSDCLVGAAEKVPSFLHPPPSTGPAETRWKEGACFLLASGVEVEKEETLFEVADYFSLQLKPDGSPPPAFVRRLEGFWQGAEWLGAPAGTPLESLFPRELKRYVPNPAVFELGLGGWESLEAFLASPHFRGVIAVFSGMERKISLLKITQGKRRN